MLYSMRYKATLREVICLPEVKLLFFSDLLHFAWEVMQSPFYAFKVISLEAFVLCTIYCSSIDVIITASILLFFALVKWNRWWFLHPSSWDIVCFLAINLALAILVEYLNVYAQHDWGYLPSMPIILGIGLFPMLQWIILPAVLVFILQHTK